MFVSYHGSGPCNRIKSLISAMRLDDNCKIIWPKNSYVNCSFNDLFKNRIVHPFKGRITRSNIRKIFGKNYYAHWRFVILPKDNIDYNIDFMYNDTPKKIRKVFLDKLKILKPIDYILKNVNSFSKNFDDKTVSVSIRSWAEADKKFNSKAMKRSKTFNLNLYIKAMENINDVSNFFVTTDSDKIIDKLKTIFPNKIIIFPSRNCKGDKSVKGMQDAFVDLYLGGKNKRLIVSNPSSFSELQWWFGNCKSEVTKVKSF